MPGLLQVNATKFPSGDSDGQFSSPGSAVRGISLGGSERFVDVANQIELAEMIPTAAVNASHFLDRGGDVGGSV
jgi:hypothetical protein